MLLVQKSTAINVICSVGSNYVSIGVGVHWMYSVRGKRQFFHTWTCRCMIVTSFQGYVHEKEVRIFVISCLSAYAERMSVFEKRKRQK